MHPRDAFPTTSLIALGVSAAAFTWLPLDAVITSLIVIRALVQFMGQIVAVPLLRRRLAESERPYRMWFYPLPALIAFAGWSYIFLTAGWAYVAVGVATLLAGIAAFLLRAYVGRLWPFTAAPAVSA